jgi:hypothetical protein
LCFLNRTCQVVRCPDTRVELSSAAVLDGKGIILLSSNFEPRFTGPPTGNSPTPPVQAVGYEILNAVLVVRPGTRWMPWRAPGPATPSPRLLQVLLVPQSPVHRLIFQSSNIFTSRTYSGVMVSVPHALKCYRTPNCYRADGLAHATICAC